MKEQLIEILENCVNNNCKGCQLFNKNCSKITKKNALHYLKDESTLVENIYENAQITDVSLEINDHCCLTFSITLKGSGWGASFGGYNLAFFNGTSFEGSEKGLEALTRIMDVVGVAKWEDIKGHYVRVKQEDRLVVGIGNVIEDKWFEPREFFKGD
jgi:hypothetical protein